jgi:hypothetical protein
MNPDFEQRNRSEQYDNRDCGDKRREQRVAKRIIDLQPPHAGFTLL